MKTNRFRNFLWLAPIAMILMWQLPAHLRAQASGAVNVTKDIMDHKGILNWKPAGTAFPRTSARFCRSATAIPKWLRCRASPKTACRSRAAYF